MFIVLLLLLLASVTYTSWRFWLLLPLPVAGKALFVGLYILCFLTVFLHFARGNRMPLWAATASYEAGTCWMIFFLYALLLFLALDLGRLVHLVPASFLKDSWAGTGVVLGVLLALLAYGSAHYRHKYREVIEIQTDKPIEKPLTIVLASDIHAGYHNRKAELSRWVDLLNAEKPDLVLFAGDLLDGAIRPARAWYYEEEFRRLSAPVYACLGNHEYITGIEESLSFYADAGIHLLRDASTVLPGLQVIGRDDRSNRDRKTLAQLSPSDSLFTLLLDHQPYHLEEAEHAGIDFQFSGHTHHGQVWPGNWITDALYEKAFGAHRRGKTLYYVSSGLGIWGGKFRIGTRSEYIVLKINP